MSFSQICKPGCLEQSHSGCSVFVPKFRFFSERSCIPTSLTSTPKYSPCFPTKFCSVVGWRIFSHFVADLVPCVRCPHTAATYVILQIRKPLSHRCLSFLSNPLFPFPLLPRHTRGLDMSSLPLCGEFLHCGYRKACVAATKANLLLYTRHVDSVSIVKRHTRLLRPK